MVDSYIPHNVKSSQVSLQQYPIERQILLSTENCVESGITQVQMIHFAKEIHFPTMTVEFRCKSTCLLIIIYFTSTLTFVGEVQSQKVTLFVYAVRPSSSAVYMEHSYTCSHLTFIVSFVRE